MTRTTLSAAVTADDKEITIASITALAAGNVIQVNGEKMRVLEVPTAATLPVKVFRGINGTKVVAHAITSGVAFGTPDEFAKPVFGYYREREVRAYTAAGAIALPTPGNDAVAILNGTAALAMTLANPGKDQDGDRLTVIGNGKAAHTVTYTAGLGNGGSGLDVLTFDTNAQCSVEFMAANEVWVPVPSPLSGVLTGADVAVA
jgi:nitrogen fixation protein